MTYLSYSPSIIMSIIILSCIDAVFEFTQNTYFGVENVASPPDIPFSIRLASNSGILSQATTVTVTSGGGSASGTASHTLC